MPATTFNTLHDVQQQRNIMMKSSPVASDEFVEEDNSTTSLEVLQMMMMFADNRDEDNDNNKSISTTDNAAAVQEAPFASCPNAAFILQVQLSNSQHELYKTQNLLDRANDHLRSVQAHNKSLEAENARLKAENASLVANMEQKCGERLVAEKQATAKARRELEMTIYRLKVQQENAEAFDKAVAQRLQVLVDDHIKLNSNNNNNNTMIPHEKVESELANIKRQLALQSSAARKMLILNRIFDIASNYVDDTLSALVAVNQQYQNMRKLGLIRNECLFTADAAHASVAPVAKSFFKVVDEDHFMTAINSATGELDHAHFQFSFHGTRGGLATAQNIQCEGYLPQTRVGQAMGSGEYSATAGPGEYSAARGMAALTMALGYGPASVLVNLIYKPDKDDPRHPQLEKARYSAGAEFFGPVAAWPTIFVIANPPNRADGTYMLPLGVICHTGETMKRTCSCAAVSRM